jgi:hypothetical protein
MAAAQTVPTISASDMQAMEQAYGTGSYGAGTNQGLGALYTSMVPAYLQMAASGSLPANLQDDPVANWLMQNGYLQGDLASGNITGGYKSEGVQQGGTYNPTDPNNVGSGYGSDQGNQNLLLAPNNPFGYSTIGSQDVHELSTPQQNPSAFGTGAFGDPTVSKTNLAQNQDWISKFLIPLMQTGASIGFGGLGGFGQLGSLGSGLFSGAGNAITGGAGNLQSTLGSVAGSALGGGLSAAGYGALNPLLNAGIGAYNISKNPNNPGAYLGTLGQLAKLGAGS